MNSFRLVQDITTDNSSLLLQETQFHNANGYLGARGSYEEGYPEGYTSIRGQYLNGFYDIALMKQAEKLYGLPEEKQTILNVADTLGIRLSVGGESFSCFSGGFVSGSRILDMRAGTSVRKVLWRTKEGKGLEVTITRMASFKLLPLLTVEYTVRSVDYSGPLCLTSTHQGEVTNFADPNDPRVAAEAGRYLLPENARLTPEGYSVLNAETSRSALRLSSIVYNHLSTGQKGEHKLCGALASEEFAATIAPGEEITLTKYAVFCDSVREPSPEDAACKAMAQALAVPLGEWYREQKAYLDAFWANSAVQIEGDEELQRALLYNQYQLLQSAGKDGHCNIAAKGLSGEGYEGHYFWDTEMYLLPFFSLTQPAVARKLLEYRHSILPAARDNAKLLGHQSGALFPWRTISGQECSGFFPAGTAQYHINGDIAYATANYFLLTGDIDFLTQYGAELLFETARLWMDTGHFDGEAFCIHDVTGPDEYTCIVDNNYYTNALARYNLEWAVKAYSLLAQNGPVAAARKIKLMPQELADFARAAAAMKLPVDERLGINPQDDSFLHKKPWDLAAIPPEQHPLLLHYHPLALYRRQVCKQADTVLAHFILEDYQPLEVMRRSYEYYEQCTTHDSSLSTCIFSIMASRLGMPDKALHYFGESAKMDLLDLHGNTKDGIHTANMGGAYMAIVYGFAGLRVKPGGLSLAPTLPPGWQGYSFPFQYKGSHYRLETGKQQFTLTLLEGKPQPITLYGRNYEPKEVFTAELEPWGI